MELFENAFYLYKRGKYWHYRFKDEKTFHTTKQTNKTLAIAFVTKVINEGKFKNPTLDEYAKDFYKWGKCKWIKRQHAKGKSFAVTMAQSRRGQLENYILPKFGKKKLKDINPVAFEDWVISLDLANGTKNQILYSLKIILKEAKREGLVKYNPLVEVEPLGSNYKKRDAFLLEELKIMFPLNREKLIKIWGSLYYANLYYLMVTTGMRVGEAIALKWEHIIFEMSAVLIVQAVKNDNTIGTTKSGKERSVIIPNRTSIMLMWWKEETLFEDNQDFVFHGLDIKDPKKPINRSTVLKKFREGLRRAGIDTSTRNIVVHSLRHTYNTRMRSILPQETLQYMVGHSSKAMTERYDQATAFDKIQGLLSQKDVINKAWE